MINSTAIPTQQVVPLLKANLSYADFDCEYTFHIGLTRGYNLNIPKVFQGAPLSKPAVQNMLKELLHFAGTQGIFAFTITRNKGAWEGVLEDSLTLSYCSLRSEDTDAKIVSVIERAKSLFEQDVILLKIYHQGAIEGHLL